MLKGKSLKKNSTLGIIAPASPQSKDFIDKKVAVLSSLGFNIKLGKHIYDIHGHFAGSDKDRADDIMDMFLDNDVDGILCFRGGYGSIRTIPYLDTDKILKHPKFFCGYSDITILLNYFSSLGLITFHGPMVNSDFNDSETQKSFFDIINCTENSYSYDFKAFNNISFINANSFSGRIVGGNLSMICSAIGTPYDINFDNSILLLEDVNESPYCIDRMLTQLIISNKLSECNGILLGHFAGCYLKNYAYSLTIEQVIYDRLSPLNIPIIKGIPFGHDYPNLTIPIGRNGIFDYNNLTLTVCDKMFL